jgi:hypothetical protein
MTNIELLEQAYALVSNYSNVTSRPAITDLACYDVLIGMHDTDYEDVNNMSYIWFKTPDEVMQHILDSNEKPGDLEYGWEQFDEEIRDYLLQKEFIAYADDVSDEELQANLKQRIK